MYFVIIIMLVIEAQRRDVEVALSEVDINTSPGHTYMSDQHLCEDI